VPLPTALSGLKRHFSTKTTLLSNYIGNMLHVSPTTPFKLIESYVGAKICTVVFHLKFCSRLFEECDEHQDCFPAECRKRRNSRSFEVTCAHNAHSSSGRL